MNESEQFEKYCKENNVSTSHNYKKGIENIQEKFNINVCDEFNKDKCSNLLRKIKNLKDKKGNKRNWLAYLKKYIEFKNSQSNGEDESSKKSEKTLQSKEGKSNNNIPLNQILYGPPGTGKTYNTILKAMSIIDNAEYKDVSEEKYSELENRFDELKHDGQIEFVTFHQSYSYEEFVEGIKPNLNDDKLGYTCEPGYLKIFAVMRKK